MKIKWNKILFYSVVILLAAVLLIYYYFNGCKEGLGEQDYYPNQIIYDEEAIIKKIEIKGNDYLNLSEILLYDVDMKPYTYETDFTLDLISSPQFYKNNDIELGYQYLFDKNPATFMHSGSNKNIVFSINMIKPVFLSKLVIRNRNDCCWERLANFTIYMYDADNKVIFSKVMNDPSLTSYKPTVISPDFKSYLENKHKYDNVISYEISRYGYLIGGEDRYKHAIENVEIIDESNQKYYVVKLYNSSQISVMQKDNKIVKTYKGVVDEFDAANWGKYQTNENAEIYLFPEYLKSIAPVSTTPVPTTPVPYTSSLSTSVYYPEYQYNSILYNL